MKKGWFRINRNLFDNQMWFLEPFTKAQAWIDLIGNTNHKDKTINIRGNLIKIKRGQLGWSQITMGKRWRWSRQKVRRFLELLVREEMIDIDNSEITSGITLRQTKKTIQQNKKQNNRYLTTIITIKNYDKYQNDTTDDTAERQQKDSRRYITKNDKNDKQIINKYIQKKPPLKTYTDKKLTLDQVAEGIVKAFNINLKRNFKLSKGIIPNIEYWLDVYTPKEIERAIRNIQLDDFWNGKMTPTILFRRKNPQGEPVDYISQLLNLKEDLWTN